MVRIHWGRLLAAAVLLFGLVHGVMAFARKIIHERKIHYRLIEARHALKKIAGENLRLEKEKEALYSPEKIRELAMEKLGLAARGELAVKVIFKKKKRKNRSVSKILLKKMKEEFNLDVP
jgi:hypothetical protein